MAIGALWEVTDVSNARGAAVDADGNVYVAYSNSIGTPCVRKISPAGVQLWATNDARYARWIGLDASNNVYVGYAGWAGEPILRKYNSEGALQWTINCTDSTPSGMGVDLDGNVSMAHIIVNSNSYYPNRLVIRRYKSSGAAIGEISLLSYTIHDGLDPWGKDDPQVMRIDTLEGSYENAVSPHNTLGPWGTTGSIYDLTVGTQGDISVVYVTTVTTEWILDALLVPAQGTIAEYTTQVFSTAVFNSSGTLIFVDRCSSGTVRTFTDNNIKYPAYPLWPTDPIIDVSATIDSSGNVYVAQGRAVVKKFSSSGSLIWEKSLALDADNCDISSMAVDLLGNIYVAYFWPGYLAKFDSSGTLIWSFASASNDDAMCVVTDTTYAYVCHWDKVIKVGELIRPRTFYDGFVIGYQCGSRESAASEALVTAVYGPKGPTGDQGPVGPEGAKGATGSTGATGSQGPKGATGAKGATGPDGKQGDPGPQGDQGAKGTTGIQGIKGIDGAQGPIGPQACMFTDIQLYDDGVIVTYADSAVDNYSWTKDAEGRLTNLTTVSGMTTISYIAGATP